MYTHAQSSGNPSLTPRPSTSLTKPLLRPLCYQSKRLKRFPIDAYPSLSPILTSKSCPILAVRNNRRDPPCSSRGWLGICTGLAACVTTEEGADKYELTTLPVLPPPPPPIPALLPLALPPTRRLPLLPLPSTEVLPKTRELVLDLEEDDADDGAAVDDGEGSALLLLLPTAVVTMRLPDVETSCWPFCRRSGGGARACARACRSYG